MVEEKEIPSVVNQYNLSIRGVDLANQRSKYHFNNRKTVEWTIKIIFLP